MKKKIIILISIILVIISMLLVNKFCFMKIVVVNEKNRYLDMHLISNGSLYGYADANGYAK